MYCVLGWRFREAWGRSARKYNRACRGCFRRARGRELPKCVFEEIGYFDEMHFAYLEDMDVDTGRSRLGYDNVYCPDAVVYHVGERDQRVEV